MAKSRTSIYAALISNTAIGVIKFVAAYFSGSSAMLSEGIHSIVDSCNELLLLFGISRSKRPADIEHPIGHGQDLYFWSLIVSILVFGLGGGMSVYEGINHVRNPIPLDDVLWNYIVLGIALIFEVVSFYIAVRDFLKEPGTKGHFWSNLRKSKDPGFFIVIYEGVGDLAGLIIAFGGVVLSHYFNSPVIDGIASILIGLVLTVIAILMIIESRNLLIGETADLQLVKKTEELIRSDQDVFEVQRPLTVQLSPDEVFLALNLQFRNELSGAQVVEGINRLEKAIRAKFPQIRQIYLEAQHLSKNKRE